MATESASSSHDLGKTIDEAEQHLASADAANFDRLDFVWEGMNVTARSDDSETEQPVVHIEARMGRLYYTVEDDFQRGAALERISSANREIDGRYQVSRNGNVRFRSATATTNRMLGAELVTAATLILLEGEHHLRALRTHLKAN